MLFYLLKVCFFCVFFGGGRKRSDYGFIPILKTGLSDNCKIITFFLANEFVRKFTRDALV